MSFSDYCVEKRIFVSLKAFERLAKRYERLFLSVGRQIGEGTHKRMKKHNKSPIVACRSQGMMEGMKRQ